MKKVITALLTMAMLVSFSSCDNKNDETTNEEMNNTVARSELNSDLASEFTSADENKPDTSVKKRNSYKNCGMEIYIPEGFEDVDIYAKHIYSGELSTVDTAYIAGISVPWYEGDKVTELSAVEDFMKLYIWENVDSIYNCNESSFAIEAESEEDAEVLDFKMLKKSGVLHTNSKSTGSDHLDLRYFAYYTTLTSPEHMYDANVPICWIAFSECGNEGSETELEKMIDYVAENVEWYEWFEK